jgi:hypothetical protein
MLALMGFFLILGPCSPHGPSVPTFHELHARVLDQPDRFRAVLAHAGGSPEEGFYVCCPRFPGDARGLPRTSRFLDRWNGVVLIDWFRPHYYQPQDFESWGRHAAAAGPFLLFGDPDLIAELLPYLN